MVLSLGQAVVLIVAIGFLLFALTRSRRTVASVLFGGLLLSMASGLFFLVVDVRAPAFPSQDDQPSVAASLSQAPRTYIDLEPAAIPVGGEPRATPAAANTAGVKPKGTPSVRGSLVDGVYSEEISSGFRTSEAECYPHLLDEALERTRLYADAVFGPGAGERMALDPRYIRDRVLTELTVERRNFEFGDDGDMVQVRAKVAFDDGDRQYLRNAMEDGVARRRMVQLGAGSLAALLVLGSFFSYLKLDTATKGYYSGRLKVAAGVVAATAVAGAVALIV